MATTRKPSRPHYAGRHPADPLTPYGNRPMVTPIVNAVNYEYLDFEVLRQITDGEIDGYTYHRDDNPTVRAVEKKIAALEQAQDCVVCTTGMAACTMVYLTYLRAGGHLLLFHDIYGAHYKVSLILERLGVEVTWVDATDWPRLERQVKPNTQMIFLETPSNPLCKSIDVAAVKAMARRVGARVVVDNTFATPYHQNPLALGADLVVHSATKALGGHNDLMAGAIAGSKGTTTSSGSHARPSAPPSMPTRPRCSNAGSRHSRSEPNEWLSTPWPWPNTSSSAAASRTCAIRASRASTATASPRAR